MNISIVSPEILSGFCFEVSDEKLKVKSDTYNFDYDKDIVNDFCPITRLYDVFTSANELKPEFIEKNGFLIAEFKSDNQNCVLKADKDSMRLVEVEFDEYIYKFKA